MRKFVLYGILLFGLHHLLVPAAKAVKDGAKKAAHIAYKVAV